MARGLLIVDIQRDYFPGGAYPLVGSEDASAAAKQVLGRCREEGVPVVHLRHIWDAPDATFMRPGTEGVEIHPDVEPSEGERRAAAPEARREEVFGRFAEPALLILVSLAGQPREVIVTGRRIREVAHPVDARGARAEVGHGVERRRLARTLRRPRDDGVRAVRAV